MTKKLLSVLQGIPGDPPPIWLMRQAGRYLPEYRKIRAQADSFLSLCFTPELAVEVTLQPLRRFALDGAVIFSDILVIPLLLGRQVSFTESAGVRVDPIENPRMVDRICNRFALRGTRSNDLDPVYEAIEMARAQIPEDCALIGFVGAPWTLAAYMVDGDSKNNFAKTRYWLDRYRISLTHLCDFLEEWIVAHAIAQIRAGAEVIQIFDSWVGLLPATEQEEWCVHRIISIARRVQAMEAHAQIIVFARGASRDSLLRLAIEGRKQGIALSIDENLSMVDVRKSLDFEIPLQGNMDPDLLVTGGEKMRHSASELVTSQKGRPFIFNLGHGVKKETPPEHVGELVRFVREISGKGGEA